MRVLGWVGVLWLAGCGGSDPFGLTEDTDVPTALPELPGELLAASPTTTAPAPLPAWAGAIPPHGQASMLEREQVLARVCFGSDPDWMQTLEPHLEAEGKLPEAIGWTRTLVDGCRAPSQGFCQAVGERVRALEPGAEPSHALWTLWHIAGGCADPAVWSWIANEGGPVVGVADYLATQDNLWRPVVDPDVVWRMAPMLDADPLHRGAALQALAAVDHPESADLLLRDHAAQTTPEDKELVALWMYRQSDPRARARFETTCTVRPAAWQCVEGLDPLADLDTTVRTSNVDLSALLSRHPGHRKAILEAMERCLIEGAEGLHEQGGRCMKALAGAGATDRLTAVLEGLDASELDPYWQTRRTAWLELGGLGMGRALASRGLLPADPAPLDASEPPVFLADWFLESQHGLDLSRRSNAQVLVELLGQVPELADLVVVVRAPAGDGPEPLDELLVWVDGTRHRALARPYGADTLRIAAFANALAQARELEVRFLPLPGGAVIWGPEDALRALVDEGLVEGMGAD